MTYLQPGTRVKVYTTFMEHPLPANAVIVRNIGNSYLVRYDNGRQEWTHPGNMTVEGDRGQ